MNHPKAVMWSVIVCFAVILGVIYYISVSLVSQSSPPYSTPQMPAGQRPTPQQTEQTLNTLKATSTTKTTTPTQDQKTVNSLKASSTTSTKNSAQTNQTLDSLKAH